MLTTSVNESGAVPLNEYDEINEKYKDLVDKIYNTNTNSSNIASTVVLLTGDNIKVLREGEITLSQINEVLKNI